MRFSKKVIVTMFISVFIFVVTMIVLFCKFGSVPDVLIDNFFAFFGIEGGALAIIKVGEVIAEKIDKKEKTAKKAARKEKKS